MQLPQSIAANNGGMIEAKLAAHQGVSRSVLSRLCPKGEILRIVSGQYVFPQDMQDKPSDEAGADVALRHDYDDDYDNGPGSRRNPNGVRIYERMTGERVEQGE